MPAGDPLLTRELKALQDDLSTVQRRRRVRQDASPAAAVEVPAGPSPGGPAAEKPHDDSEDADAQKLREQVREFFDETAEFFHEAEKNIGTHPISSVLGALLIGILIGRMLGRH